MRRPKLNAKIFRGLAELVPAIDGMLTAASDYLPGLSESQLEDVGDALGYMAACCHWWESSGRARSREAIDAAAPKLLKACRAAAAELGYRLADCRGPNDAPNDLRAALDLCNEAIGDAIAGGSNE